MKISVSFLLPKKNKKFPSASINKNNLENRRQRVIQDLEDEPDKESIKIERSIQKDLPDVKVKAYLRGKYRNSGHELICQCCREEMPFKINEYHYFEAVQCVKNFNKLIKQNYLALCPTCAAKYKHARETNDDEMRRRLIENGSPVDSSSVIIQVRLAGDDLTIEFVGTHWFDLKTILQNSIVEVDL